MLLNEFESPKKNDIEVALELLLRKGYSADKISEELEKQKKVRAEREETARKAREDAKRARDILNARVTTVDAMVNYYMLLFGEAGEDINKEELTKTITDAFVQCEEEVAKMKQLDSLFAKAFANKKAETATPQTDPYQERIKEYCKKFL